MIEFSCAGCGKRFRVPDSKGGKRAKCPDCGTRIQIPAPVSCSHAGRTALSSPDREVRAIEADVEAALRGETPDNTAEEIERDEAQRRAAVRTSMQAAYRQKRRKRLRMRGVIFLILGAILTVLGPIGFACALGAVAVLFHASEESAGVVMAIGVAVGYLVAVALLTYGLAQSMMSKGYSPGWCLLGLLGLIGLVVLALMPDKGYAYEDAKAVRRMRQEMRSLGY